MLPLRLNKNYGELTKILESLGTDKAKWEDENLTFNIIEASKRATDRTCGDCNMCCRIFSIETVDNKPAGPLCKHWCNGCTIYKDRPPVCRNFSCTWLTDDFFGPEWWPVESKMMILCSNDSYRITPELDYQNRWCEEPYYSKLKELARIGLTEPRKHSVYVSLKETDILVLPDKDVEVNDAIHMIVYDGISWDAVKFATVVEAERYRSARKMTQTILDQTPASMHKPVLSAFYP
jgi:hypothetical protein